MASNPSFSKGRVPYSVNVLGFGADPTGASDSRAAFDAAVDECRNRDYSTLYIPAGVYKVSSFGGGVGK
ncbi:MAG: hypothetical protein H6809_01130 [Phycisphaeraceae bacterium]|nr:hypothetical protein [Phycisphaeraceae bacterium]